MGTIERLVQDEPKVDLLGPEQLVLVIDSMADIRRKSSDQEVIPEEQQDKYLALAKILATGIENFPNRLVKDKVQSLDRYLYRTENAKFYDPIQEDYWKSENHDMVKTLDELLIAVQGDHFNCIEDKYHIFQAIKYLHASGLPNADEKSALFSTILPITTQVCTPGDGLFKKVLGSLLGAHFIVENKEGAERLTLRVFGDPENIDYAINRAKESGYKAVEALVPSKTASMIRSAMPGSEVLRGMEEEDIPGPLKSKWQRIIWGVKKETMLDDYQVVRVPLTTQTEEKKHEQNLVPSLEKIATSVGGDKIEKSLVWDETNHFAFGKKFHEYVVKTVKDEMKQDFALEPRMNREKGFVAYHFNRTIGDYVKYTTLFCKPNERYLVTTISEKGKDNGEALSDKELAKLAEATFPRESSISQVDPDFTIKEIGSMFDARFAHYRIYSKGVEYDNRIGLR